MFPAAPFFATLLLAISVAASPVEVRSTGAALPFSKRINTSGGPFNPVQHDQAHLAALKKRAAAIQSGQLNARDPTYSIPATDVSGAAYMIPVKIGTPPTTYNLHVDLSSSNIFVGVNKPYIKTSTSKDTGLAVAIPYKYGLFFGDEWLDTVSLSSELVVTKQSIGVGAEAVGFASYIDGVIGLGPTDLTLGTLTDQPGVIFNTVIDNLYSQAVISQDVLSVSFTPPTSGNDVNGELTFGGTDPSKYIGELNYVPISQYAPSSVFWGLDGNVVYGNKTLVFEGPGLVDSTSTMVLISNDAHEAYMQATGAIQDTATNMLKLTNAQYGNLQDLHINIGTTTYTLIPNAQIWPRALNSYIGGSEGAIYSAVGRTSYGQAPNQGINFVLGQAFLERYYSVFDSSRHQIGFAMTNHTNAIIN